MKKALVIGIGVIAIIIAILFVLLSSNKSNVLSFKILKERILSYKISDKISDPNKSLNISKNSSNIEKNSISNGKKENNPNNGKLPGPLRDTNVDGKLMADANGKLIITRDLRNVFDYFMAAISEEPLESIKGRIENYAKSQLSQEAVNEVMSILNSYIEYQKNLTKFDSGEKIDPSDKQAYISEIKKAISDRMDLRRKYMSGEIINAFFSEEDAYDLFSIQRLEVENNGAISANEKEVIIEQLEQQLPDDIRDRRQRIKEEALLEKEIEELSKKEGNSDKIHELRSSFYGKEAADRLAELDKKRSEWAKRVEEYHKNKEKILASTDITNEEKQNKIKELEKSNFNEAELLEIEILEKTKNQKPNQKK